MQSSLKVPNERGLPQLMMERLAGKPVLFRVLESLTRAGEIDRITVVCSRSPEDDAIHETANAFRDARVPVDCLRIEDGDPGSFEPEYCRAAQNLPAVLEPVTGMFHIDRFLDHLERTNAGTALLASAESLPFMDAETLDAMVRLSERRISLFTGGYRQGTLAVLPFFVVKDLYQEWRSETVQARLFKKNRIKAKGDQAQMRAFERFCNRRTHVMCLKNKIERIINWPALQDRTSKLRINPLFALRHAGDLAFLDTLLSLNNRLRKTVRDTPNGEDPLHREEFLETGKRLDRVLREFREVRADGCEHLVVRVRERDETRRGSLSTLLEKTLDRFSNPPGMVTLDCSNAPERAPGLIDAVKHLRQRRVFHVRLKTAGASLAVPELARLKEAGLSALALSLEDFDDFDSFREYVESCLAFRDSLKRSREFSIDLETEYGLSRQERIRACFERFEFRVDRITVYPERDPDPPTLELDDEAERRRFAGRCPWSAGTLVVNENGAWELCEEQNAPVFETTSEGRQSLEKQRGRLAPCRTCVLRFRRNGFEFPENTDSLLIGNDPEGPIPWLRMHLDSLFAVSHFSADPDSPSGLPAWWRSLFDLGIRPDHLVSWHGAILECARALGDKGRPAEALDLVETVLKADPANTAAHSLLERWHGSFNQK
jgi:hypothetical protein